MNTHEIKYKDTLNKVEEGKRLSPITAIRLNCLECCGWQETEVRKCTLPECILYKFRMGRNNTGTRPSARIRSGKGNV